jgi:hypothetical protein
MGASEAAAAAAAATADGGAVAEGTRDLGVRAAGRQTQRPVELLALGDHLPPRHDITGRGCQLGTGRGAVSQLGGATTVLLTAAPAAPAPPAPPAAVAPPLPDLLRGLRGAGIGARYSRWDRQGSRAIYIMPACGRRAIISADDLMI